MYVNSQMSCNLNTTVLAMNYNSQTYIVMAISGAEYDLKEIGKEMKQAKGSGGNASHRNTSGGLRRYILHRQWHMQKRRRRRILPLRRSWATITVSQHPSAICPLPSSAACPSARLRHRSLGCVINVNKLIEQGWIERDWGQRLCRGHVRIGMSESRRCHAWGHRV